MMICQIKSTKEQHNLCVTTHCDSEPRISSTEMLNKVKFQQGILTCLKNWLDQSHSHNAACEESLGREMEQIAYMTMSNEQLKWSETLRMNVDGLESEIHRGKEQQTLNSDASALMRVSPDLYISYE